MPKKTNESAPKEPSFVSKVIDATDKKRVCDEVCKKILATKEIAAHILRAVVSEYSECSIDEIMQYISDDVEIGNEPIDADVLPPTIHTDNSEDSTIFEGKRFFDIKFTAKTPNKKERDISLIINIEAQKNYNPGYSLIKRGIYYCGRLLSAQYGAVFTNSDYDKLRKVYSIWVCTNPDKTYENTITEYHISPVQLFGKFETEKRTIERRKEYDMIDLIMICLDDYDSEKPSENGIIRLLTVLFDRKTTAKNKKAVLQNEYNIKMTKEIDEEVEKLCDVSQMYFEEGEMAGRREQLSKIIINMLKRGKSPEEIADLIGIDVRQVEEIAN